MMTFIKAAVAVIVMMISTSAYAGNTHHHHDHSVINHGDLVLKDIRIKALMPGAKVTAGYLDITNNGDDDRLIAVEIKGANKSEIHTMSMDGGIMKMRPLNDGIDLPKGETISLAPGGLHLMFMKLDDFPNKGEMADLTLIFEKAGALSVKAPVKMIKPGHSGHSH